MSTLENIKERFYQVQSGKGDSNLKQIEQNAFLDLNRLGIPTTRNEEWKYTRIGSVFNKEFQLSPDNPLSAVTVNEVDRFRLPGSEKANELVFINGTYSPSLSRILSSNLVVEFLDIAVHGEYSQVIEKHLGNSGKYVKDGIYAMNAAFAEQGLFIHLKKGDVAEHPVYIYNITDNRSLNVLSQPRVFFYLAEHSEIIIAETYGSLGTEDSFTNQVSELIVEKDANVEYYKIQNDGSFATQVSTTHFRQVGKSNIHSVTISLSGNIIRNNLNISLEAEYSEANLHGLYFLKGQTHIDNHTVADHVKPNCQSNELYKGIIDNNGTAVFNGKIFVRQDAQKTNAFQSNKNVLLSDAASVNTKPQLEIFADDVKCSHGCTVGQLDDEGLFYLRSRGISEKVARSLLVHAFAIDILEHIKLQPLREYVDQLISERLEFEIA
jgi:Fe-S cluster assembly protein SufD